MSHRFRASRKSSIFFGVVICLLMAACQFQLGDQPALTSRDPDTLAQSPAENPDLRQPATETLAPIPSQTATLTPTATATQTPSPSVTPTRTLPPTPTCTPTAYGGYKPGQLFAFNSGHAVEVNRSDGTNPITLFEYNKFPSLLGWSPDGQWVFFTEAIFCSGDCPIETHLWAARPDGSEMKTVFTNRADSHEIAWKPDGSTFVFGCAPDPAYWGNKQFCFGRMDDFSFTTTDFWGVEPQYSSDGEKLAWVRFPTEQINTSILNVLEDPGADPIAVITYKNWIPEFRWLPDNQTLVYVERKSSSTCEIFQVDYQNPLPSQLIALEECYQSLIFLGEPSPDGSYLVYYYQKKPYILDLRSPDKTVQARGLRDARLYWSPDGKLIGLVPGMEAVQINPETGDTTVPDASVPWLSISRWSTANRIVIHEIFLQP